MDSPALNAHSRAVRIPLSRHTAEPTNIVVAGPGPAETHIIRPSPPPVPTGLNTSKPPPPIPTDSALESEDLLDLSEAEVDDDDIVSTKAKDPYSNIDGAFGNYMLDEPQPMTAGKVLRGDLDDLLF